MQPVNVQKRDGNVEIWSADKLITSMGKAGVSINDAERIAKELEHWAKENAQNGIISSNQIRDKVSELLKTQFPLEGDSYIAYKKQ